MGDVQVHGSKPQVLGGIAQHRKQWVVERSLSCQSGINIAKALLDFSPRGRQDGAMKRRQFVQGTAGLMIGATAVAQDESAEVATSSFRLFERGTADTQVQDVAFTASRILRLFYDKLSRRYAVSATDFQRRQLWQRELPPGGYLSVGENISGEVIVQSAFSLGPAKVPNATTLVHFDAATSKTTVYGYVPGELQRSKLSFVGSGTFARAVGGAVEFWQLGDQPVKAAALPVSAPADRVSLQGLSSGSVCALHRMSLDVSVIDHRRRTVREHTLASELVSDTRRSRDQLAAKLSPEQLATVPLATAIGAGSKGGLLIALSRIGKSSLPIRVLKFNIDGKTSNFGAYVLPPPVIY